MAENLDYINYDYYPDTIDFTMIHDKPTAPLFYDNGDYGVLYNWYAAIDAAPEGWHLPSEDEWARLIEYMGGEDIAGLNLKDPYGFAALAGGIKTDEFSNHSKEQSGSWWGYEQWQYSISFTGDDCVTKRDFKDDKAFARYLSIRCIKDETTY